VKPQELCGNQGVWKLPTMKQGRALAAPVDSLLRENSASATFLKIAFRRGCHIGRGDIFARDRQASEKEDEGETTRQQKSHALSPSNRALHDKQDES